MVKGKYNEKLHTNLSLRNPSSPRLGLYWEIGNAHFMGKIESQHQKHLKIGKHHEDPEI
jgi:hypothetical protein